jgi:hypothetical protein
MKKVLSVGFMVLGIGTILTFVMGASTAANAACYKILPPGVSQVFTMPMAAASDKLCVIMEHRRLGGDYYSLEFRDKLSDTQGNLGVFISYSGTRVRCPNCVDESYLIEAGNAGGISFSPLSISVKIKIPAGQVVGKVILTDNQTGQVQEFLVR